MFSSVRNSRVMLGALMVMLTSVSYINRTAMPIAGPAIMKEFGLTQTQMGTIYSAFLFSYAILMVPEGALTDRFGPRLILGITGLAAAGVTALAALAGHPPMSTFLSAFASFHVIRLLVGAFYAPLFPGCSRMIANWFDSGHRARMQGLVTAGAPLGAAFTPVFISWLIARDGWRNALLVSAAITGAASLIWILLARDVPQNGNAAPPPPKGSTSWLRLLGDPGLLILSASYFALNYFEYIFFYWIYFYFGEVRHMPGQAGAIYTTILLLTMMVASTVGGWLSDSLGSRWGIILGRRFVAGGGMAASAFLLVFGVNAHSDGMIVFLLALALGFAAAAEGPFMASAIDMAGPDAGAAVGVMNGIGNVGGLIAPVLTPYLAERAGWSAGLYFASAVVLVGATAWISYPSRRT
jgi:sugar phosphate permease